MGSLLCVSHNIFLDRDQRYAIYEGNEIEVVGVSVPVWIEKGETNEPASEVFCKYSIKCDNRSFQKNIEILEDGYEIRIFKNNIFDGLSNKIKKYFKSKDTSHIPTAKSLLDIKDGGSEWINFKSYEMHENYTLVHSVEIQKIENLLNSLVS